MMRDKVLDSMALSVIAGVFALILYTSYQVSTEGNVEWENFEQNCVTTCDARSEIWAITNDRCVCGEVALIYTGE